MCMATKKPTKTKIVCVSHEEDADGISSAALIKQAFGGTSILCLLYTSPSPRDGLLSRMPSSA